MDTKEKLKMIYENPHVWAIGDGYRTKNGTITDEKCTVANVEKKGTVSARFMLSPEIDVVESGIIRH